VTTDVAKHFTVNALIKIPVKMFVKASSTLVESKADVSTNAKLFLSKITKKCSRYIHKW